MGFLCANINRKFYVFYKLYHTVQSKVLKW